MMMEKVMETKTAGQMLEVTKTRMEDGKDVFLLFKGHAGKAGGDDVCAMASALFFTLLSAADEAGMLAGYNDDWNGGAPFIRLSPRGAGDGGIIAAVESGYRMLERAYPENVRWIDDEE